MKTFHMHSNRLVAKVGGVLMIMICVAALLQLATNFYQDMNRPDKNAAIPSRTENWIDEKEFSRFVESSLRPTVRSLVDVDAVVLEQAMNRMRPSERTTASNLVHYLHLTSRQAVVTTNSGEIPIVDLLLDNKLGDEYFEGAAPMLRTRYGVRFTPYQRLMLGTPQPSAEAHPGQVLSILGTIGVSKSREIQPPGGPPSTLGEAVEDLCSNFILDDEEIYWHAIALAIYVLPDRSWQNRYGELFTFDILANELLSRSSEGSACAGTHRMIALAVLYRVHQQVAILDNTTEKALKCELAIASKNLVSNQDVNGSWTPSWHRATTVQSRKVGEISVSTTERVITTGHHLEWLILLPDDVRPPDSVLIKATRFLMSTVPSLTEDTTWLAQNYCPATHALRSISLLSRQRDISVSAKR